MRRAQDCKWFKDEFCDYRVPIWVKETSRCDDAMATDCPCYAEVLHQSIMDIANQYVGVFNACFKRRVGVTPGTVKKVTRIMAEGQLHSWQIIAHPILVAAQGMGKDNGPEVLLRDGSRQRRTKEGYDAGGYDWITGTWERADRTVLPPSLKAVAEMADVWDKLEKLGVTCK